MNQAALALAFAAGMVASFNPCGFSLLPAYLAMFVSGDRVEERLESRILRAIGVAAAVSAGFIAVFATAGIILDRLAAGVRTQLPWVTIAVGALLVVAGLATLAGWKPELGVVPPQLGRRGGGFRSMVGYGVTYAVASLTCTFGPFLAVTGAALNQSMIGGIATYLAYSLGMGTIILAISLAAALARTGLANRLRFIAGHAGQLGGVLMVIAGAYAIWYGRWELAVYSGDLDTDPVVDVGEDLRLWFVSRIDQLGAARLALVVASIAAVAVVVAWSSRRRPRSGPTPIAAEVEGVE
ncbi:MAG: cytochrome c biogenesis protein CcdA [Acidimicrobiia bacterium]|nr:cytochrome c biogenesis protein CcdA [Acidimicrobiia bacterium]